MHIVNATIARPKPELIARLRAAWPECVVQALVGTNALMDPAIRPLGSHDWSFAGPAVTVLPDGTDTLAGIIGVSVTEPGDVVVLAAGGDCVAGVWGGGLTLSAQNKGCAGVVVDGAALDGSHILAYGVPVFCRTSVMNHTVGHKPGSVNVDVVCGGVTVRPGDVVLGTMDGVLVVPKARLAEIVAVAEMKTRDLVAKKAQLGPGGTLFDVRGGRAMTESLGVQWND